MITFYSAGSSIGTGTLSSGVATLTIASLPIGTEALTAGFAGDANFTGSTSNSVAETVTAGSGSRPRFVVTVNTDDTTGNQYNCIGASTANGGNISFSPTVFAASQPISARTIDLPKSLIIASNTTITGPTTGSGATLTQLVALVWQSTAALEVDKGTTGVAISGLSVSGYNSFDGFTGAEAVLNDGEATISNSAFSGNASGGLYSIGSPAVLNGVDGALTLTDCIISNNSNYMGGSGGIINQGVMIVTGSTIAGNESTDRDGAGLYNLGTATLTNTTVSGNQVLFYDSGGKGGGIYNTGTLNLFHSSITGNSASLPGDGSGIYNTGTLHITSSSLVNNLSNYTPDPNVQGISFAEDDCDGPGCPQEKIPAPPVFTPPSGTYFGGGIVTLTDATPGAVYFYTTDGSTPTTASTLVGNRPIGVGNVGSATTIKAVAFVNGELSTVATATYTAAGYSACTLIDYSGGFTPGALTLNGGAAVKGSLLQLTDGGLNEARSAFYSMPVPVTEFTSDFQFQLLYPFADGITFTIQSASPSAVGQPGGGLGYAGIPKSLAVKFDLYNNNGEGYDSTGHYLDGAYPSTPALDMSAYGIHLHSGHVFAVHITYVGGVTMGTITDLATYQSYTASVPGDLTQVVGDTAYVGFTGGTGVLTATQNILTWTYGGGSGCGTPSAP
jgi:hypothetical protein